MAAAKRWILFSLALASLLVLSYAGVLLAFSVDVTGDPLLAEDDQARERRAVVAPIADPSRLEPDALLATGEKEGMFPSGSTNVSLARALAHVAPVNGSYEPANRTFTNVSLPSGTTNLTVDVAALADNMTGWLVVGADGEARFVESRAVLGEVERVTSATTLGLTFALALLGFLAPLIAVVATHKPSRKRISGDLFCRECSSPFPANAEFCLRCGAYRSGE